MIKDGLWMLFGYHMGITAENVAEKFQVTRKSRIMALNFQEKAESPKENKFKKKL